MANYNTANTLTPVNIPADVFDKILIEPTIRRELQTSAVTYIVANITDVTNPNIILYTELLDSSDFVTANSKVEVNIQDIWDRSGLNADATYTLFFTVKQDVYNESNLAATERSNLQGSNYLTVQEISTDRRELVCVPVGSKEWKDRFIPLEETNLTDLGPVPSFRELINSGLRTSEFRNVLLDAISHILEQNLNSKQQYDLYDITFDRFLGAVTKLVNVSKLPQSNFSRFFLTETSSPVTPLPEKRYTSTVDERKAFLAFGTLLTRTRQRVDRVLRTFPGVYINRDSQIKVISSQLLLELKYLFGGEDALSNTYTLIEDYIELTPNYQTLPAQIQRRFDILGRQEVQDILVSVEDIESGEITTVNRGEGYQLNIRREQFRQALKSNKPETVVLELYDVLFEVLTEEFIRQRDIRTNKDIFLNYSINFSVNDAFRISNLFVSKTVNGNNCLVVKLAEPLPNFTPTEAAWLTRDSIPVRKDIEVAQDAEPVTFPTLRNSRQGADEDASTTIVYNLKQLLSENTGSLSTQRLQDKVLERYHKDRGEVVVDFTDFSNFVHYSTAETRLEVFEYKMQVMEEYDNDIATLATISGSNVTDTEQQKEIERVRGLKENIVNGFDEYEKYLYNATSSFAWPKSASVNLSYSSGSVDPTWVELKTQASIYDDSNTARLTTLVPSHIDENTENQPYLDFIEMVGHHFDIGWSYTKALSRLKPGLDTPEDGIVKNMSWYVAQNLGFEINSLKNSQSLAEFIAGQNGTSVLSQSVESYQDELWRRIANNIPYMYKTKGTQNALRALLNTYGIPAYLYRIVEGGAYNANVSQEYAEESVIDADFYELQIESGSLDVPWTTTQSVYPSTTEVRFRTRHSGSAMWLVNGENDWGVLLDPTTGDLGQVKLYDGSDTFLESIEAPIYSNTPFTFAFVSSSTQGFTAYLKEFRGGTLYTYGFSTGSATLTQAEYTSPSTLSFGSSSAISTGGNYSGSIDEVKLWNQVLPEPLIDVHTKYKDSIQGNGTYAFANELVFRVGLENIGSTTITSSVLLNEAINQSYATSGSLTLTGSMDIGIYSDFVSPRYVGTNKKTNLNVLVQDTVTKDELVSNGTFTGSFGADWTVVGGPTSGSVNTTVAFTDRIYQNIGYLSQSTAKRYTLSVDAYGPTGSYIHYGIGVNSGSNDFVASSSVYFSGSWVYDANVLLPTLTSSQEYFVKVDAFGLTGSAQVELDNVSLADTQLYGDTSVTRKPSIDALNDSVIELLFSPTEQQNKDIFAKLGDINIDDIIGDLRTGSLGEYVYPELESIGRIFYDTTGDRPYVNSFIKFIRVFDNSVYSNANKLVPSRAKFNSGVVLENSILGRQHFRDTETFIYRTNNTYKSEDNEVTQSIDNSFINTFADTYTIASQSFQTDIQTVKGGYSLQDRTQERGAINTVGTRRTVLPLFSATPAYTGSFIKTVTDRNRLRYKDPILQVLPEEAFPLQLSSTTFNSDNGFFVGRWTGGVKPYNVLVELSSSSGFTTFDLFRSSNDSIKLDLTDQTGSSDSVRLQVSSINGLDPVSGSASF